MKLWARGMLLLMISSCILFPEKAASLEPEPWNGEIVRVAYVTELAPYQFEEEGQLKGIHIEIMNEVARQSKLKLEWQPYPTLSKCESALKEGRADVVLGVPFSSTEFGDGFTYSLEISASYICMAVNKKIEEEFLSGDRYVGHAVLEYKSLPYSTMFQYHSITNYIGVGGQYQVFKGLTEGDADIAFGVKTCLQYYLRQAGLTKEYPILYQYIQPVNYGLLVDVRNESLLEELNEGISVVRSSQQYDQILERWGPEEKTSEVSQWIDEHLSVIVLGILGVFSVFIIIIGMNFLLRITVKKRTAELESVNKKLQDNVERAEYESELMGQAVDSHPNGILLFDEDGCIELANKNAELLLGRGKEEKLLGKNVKDFYLMRQLLKNWNISNCDENSIDIPMEVEINLENGVYFYQYSVSTFVKPGDVKNQHRIVFMVIEDVTMRKMQNSQLMIVEKSRLLNQLVAGIAHEIRNPLASLKAFAQVAKDNVGNPEYLDAFESVVPNEVDRINRLVSDLISYSKEPQLGINCSNVELKKLVHSCLALMKVLVEKYKIVIQTNIEDDLFLFVTEDHLRQVILNLLLNGIDAVRQKQRGGGTIPVPHIRMRGQRSENGIVLEIRDEGCGMSPETLERATSPFYSTKTTGTGLGLAISERYIAENGGLMTIHSIEGEYTSVQISFPLK